MNQRIIDGCLFPEFRVSGTIGEWESVAIAGVVGDKAELTN